MGVATDEEALVKAFRLQAGGCKLFGSPLYRRLCEAAIDDLGRGGPVARLVADWEGDPLRGFLALRVLGAVHERVLAGDAPRLARFYPSVGGRPEWPGVWQAFLEVVEEQAAALRPRLESFPQTNEVRRCGGLLGGFLLAAEHTGLPLRIRELGCSAGLNLHWDRYRYTLGRHRWGDPDAPVAIETAWSGGAPPLRARARVTSRAGCDLEPRRVGSPGDVRLLEAFVWPDQPERLAQLRAAVRVARERPARVDRASAEDWLPGELARPAEDACTVVYHSSVWIYLPAGVQARIRETLEERGAAAYARSPLAWLRHEDGEIPGSIELRLRLWPDGGERLLAHGHPHGRRLEWIGP
jgi:hypothetical protein